MTSGQRGAVKREEALYCMGHWFPAVAARCLPGTLSPHLLSTERSPTSKRQCAWTWPKTRVPSSLKLQQSCDIVLSSE